MPDRSAADWLLPETELDAGVGAEARNAIFSLSNGAFGCRGSLPWAPAGTHGTLIGGLYSDAPPELTWIPGPEHPGRDMVNYPSDEYIRRHERIIAPPLAPNLWRLAFDAPADRVVVRAAQRVLDLRQGVLFLSADLEIDGAAWRFESARLVSLHDRRIAAERIVLTPHDPDARLAFRLELDDSVRCQHKIDLWQSKAFTAAPGDLLLWNGTAQKTGGEAAVALCARVGSRDAAPVEIGPAGSGVRVALRGFAVVDRFLSVASSVLSPAPAAAAGDACRAAAAQGFDQVLTDHTAAVQRHGDRADIRIEGPLDDQRAVRFAIFQIGGALPRTDRYSIGAKFLTGEWYRGMVFWDTDVFMLPYLVRILPERARDHVAFRLRTLGAAMDKARREGVPGARYPWETAPDGSDATAPWLILQRTQIHVVADVAWGVLEYAAWSGDLAFMENGGRAIVRECARFCAAKVARDGSGIRDVSGPDENHPLTNNNAYTNGLVIHVLREAARRCEDVTDEERNLWRGLADSVPAPRPRADGVIEQFDGFFALPIVEINAKTYISDKYQTIKQADVVMLPMLFPSLLTEREIAANIDYYEPKTTHESSLSLGVYALVAARLGRAEQAYALFRRAAGVDLADHGRNTDQGLHAAAMALIPRMVTEGFAGLSAGPDGLTWQAHLPRAWRAVEFRALYRGEEHRIRVERQSDECRSRPGAAT